jgi:hypothetical protein
VAPCAFVCFLFICLFESVVFLAGDQASVKAMKEVTARGGDTWSTDKPPYSASSSSPKPFDLSIFPLSPKGATLDAFDVSDLSLVRAPSLLLLPPAPSFQAFHRDA